MERLWGGLCGGRGWRSVCGKSGNQTASESSTALCSLAVPGCCHAAGSQSASVPMGWRNIGHVSCILIRLYLMGEETLLQMVFFTGWGAWGLPGATNIVIYLSKYLQLEVPKCGSHNVSSFIFKG